VEIAIFRRQSVLADWPILEVISISAFTAAMSYLVSAINVLTSLSAHSLPGSLRTVQPFCVFFLCLSDAFQCSNIGVGSESLPRV
jgi:hypothetical protein